ncbi:MAG TPA: orotate phosphoribosyltransferase [Thermoanaerobaculia bacterium]|nr:orotate phosphoribosyltransferase [Thermoanaerobaculia bacterium]
MNLELDRLLHETGALLQGHFRLSSGLHSPSYVQCARLLEHPSFASAIGAELASSLHPAGVQKIVAPALGGLIVGYTVAAALNIPMVFTERKDGVMTLRRGFTIAPGERIVIVEDVVTTGKSTRETEVVVTSSGGEVVSFAAILNRSTSENPFDKPFSFLKRMSLEAFPEETCPLCADGRPLDAPGSRYSR